MNIVPQDANTDTTSPRRGRRPVAPVEPPVPIQIGAEVEAAVEELRRSAVTMNKAELAQALDTAEAVGAIAAFQYNETANRVGALRMFQKIRDAKTYKGAQVRRKDTGKIVAVNTWEEFCDAHGYSKNKINEDLQNLAVFGGTVLELQESLGLGYRELRRLRSGLAQLPEADREAVLADVQGVEGKDEAQEKLEELRIRLAQAEIKAKELKADIEAKDKRTREKNEKLDQLSEQLAKLTGMDPDARAKATARANATAQCEISRLCNELMGKTLALCNKARAVLEHEDSTDATCAWVHKSISLLCDNMDQAFRAAGIDAEMHPESLTGYANDESIG